MSELENAGKVDQFKCLGSMQTKDGTPIKEAKTIYWRNTFSQYKVCNSVKNEAISFPKKVKLYKSLVFSILLHGFESWTLTVDGRRI